MAPCRLEISLQRLLRRCESMANEQQESTQGIEWRLEKYVEALQDQLSDLNKMDSKPNPDKMSDYTKRVNFLKGFIETERKDISLNEKALSSQHLARPVTHLPSKPDSNPEKVHELHIKTKTKIEKDMRDELLGTNSQSIRNRRQGDNSTKEKDIDAVLQYHQNMQEKVADEMVRMAQSLKHTSMMANNIIQQDNKSLEASTRLVETNFVKLKHESDRLDEITSRYCSFWMWIALALVVFVFISTILFIRMFPKK